MNARIVYPGLLAFSVRRNLTPGLLLIAAAAMIFAATRDWSPPAMIESVLDAPGTADAHRRQAVWAMFVIAAFPTLLVRAAGSAARWSRYDADWFAPLPVPRFAYTLAVCVGVWGGALAVLLGALVIAEGFSGGEGTPAMRWVGSAEHPAFALVEGDERKTIVWEGSDFGLGFDPLPPGAELAIRPTIAPGSGPAVSVRASLEAFGSAPQTVERRMYGRTRIRLPVPTASTVPNRPPRARLTIERLTPGAVFVLPRRSIDVLVPAFSPRALSVELALRLAIALLAWTSVAAGLGAWMRPALASATSVALVALPLVSASALIPGADLFRAWTLVGNGIVPPALGALPVIAGFAWAAFGIALLHAGIRHGRGARW